MSWTAQGNDEIPHASLCYVASWSGEETLVFSCHQDWQLQNLSIRLRLLGLWGTVVRAADLCRLHNKRFFTPGSDPDWYKEVRT